MFFLRFQYIAWRLNGEIRNFRKCYFCFDSIWLVFHCKLNLSWLFVITISKLKHIFTHFNCRTYCVCLELYYHWFVFFYINQNTIFMYIFRLKVRWVFHWIYCSLLVRWSQSIIVCEYFVFISNSAFTIYLKLKLAKGFNLSILWLNVHRSFTLLISDLSWSLNESKLIYIREISFSEKCLELHRFWAVIYNKCSNKGLLSNK